MFKIRKPKLVKFRVFSKEQKEAFLDILKDGPDKPDIVGYTKTYIDYQVLFNYAVNFSGFMEEYRSLYPQYKFKILSIENV